MPTSYQEKKEEALRLKDELTQKVIALIDEYNLKNKAYSFQIKGIDYTNNPIIAHVDLS